MPITLLGKKISVNYKTPFLVVLLVVAVLSLPTIVPSAESTAPLREETVFGRRNHDLRSLVIDYEPLEQAKQSQVVLVDVSAAIRPFPSPDLKRTLAMPTGKTILETLWATIEHEKGRRVIDLGFVVRVFTSDRVVCFRFRQVPEDFATVKLVAGDVVLVSQR